MLKTYLVHSWCGAEGSLGREDLPGCDEEVTIWMRRRQSTFMTRAVLSVYDLTTFDLQAFSPCLVRALKRLGGHEKYFPRLRGVAANSERVRKFL